MLDSSNARNYESLGLVVIGRNEGARLARCFASVGAIPNRIYVDSGSTDGSVLLARSEGVTVVQLLIPPHFTAARARNAGLERLLADNPGIEFVQMVDGDCELQPGWIDLGLAALRADNRLALVFGRLRERFPDRSVYNALCDDEWNVSVGETSASGGNALFRVSALRQVDFYNAAMIAGEDTEMSVRLRNHGWRLSRIDAEMGLHDAAILHFHQWWARMRRSGHGYGEMAFLHPDSRDPDFTRSVLGIAAWGFAMPSLLFIAILLASSIGGRWWILVAIIWIVWPLQVARLIYRQKRRGLRVKIAVASSISLVLGKVPQFLGLTAFYLNRALGRASQLIEYKGGKVA
jgi:glycosyltransferase involved in cell wall biosynthesis